MPDPAQHLPWRGSFLILDASSRAVEAGILRDGDWAAFARSPGEALESIFRLTRSVLEQAGARLDTLDGMAWCEGPGSILGLRLGAMAIEGWRAAVPSLSGPVWNAPSLAIAALELASARGLDELEVMSDFRKGVFTRMRYAAGRLSPLELVERDGMVPVSNHPPRFYFQQRRITQEPPDDAELIEYTLEGLPRWNTAPYPGIFVLRERAEVAVPAEPEFVRWNAERHR